MLRAEDLEESGESRLLNKWLSAGDNQELDTLKILCQSSGEFQDVDTLRFNLTVVAVPIPGIRSVAPRASKIAFSEAQKNGGLACARTFALDGGEYLADVERLQLD